VLAKRLERGTLLGVDLVKPHARLHAAYNDEAGVTEQLNKNVLRVVNRGAATSPHPAATGCAHSTPP